MFLRSSPYRALLVVWGVAIALGAVGCERGQPAADSATAAAPASHAAAEKLRLLVVDDPGLAGAIKRRIGEWQARSGGEFEVVELSAAEWLEPKPKRAGREAIADDVVIYPTHYVGQLAARAAIVPLRAKVLNSDKYGSGDVFGLVWTQTATWGQEIMALPMGTPLLTLIYRPDLLERMGEAVPTNWQEYERLAGRLADRASLGDAAPPADQPWYAAVEPLGPGFAGRTLLARAAAYARNPNNYSTLFNIDTMAPLVDGPPFVRALDDLVASAKRQRGADGQLVAADPAAARRMIDGGQCAMALSWPTPAGAPAAGEKFPLAFAVLPGSRDVYDVRLGDWQPRATRATTQVPFVGYSGRVASVTSTCRNILAAQRLIAWLSGAEISSQVAPASLETTLFRTQHAAAPAPWVGAHVSAAAARQYAEVTLASLSQKECLTVPRIPGVDEYLAALDTAVQSALSGQQSSRDALAAAAAEWRAFTERLGQKSQLAAYRTSLGL